MTELTYSMYKRELIILALAIISFASIFGQITEVDTNTELRHQNQLLVFERDMARHDLTACRGDMLP